MPKQTNNSSNNAALKGFALTLVILILAVCVMAAMTEGFTNWNPYGWFDEFNAEETDAPETDAPETDEQEDKSSLIASVANSGNIKLAAVSSAENDDEITLTATVYPESVYNKKLDWSVEFVNASSSWATGKTAADYVSVTPTEDGGNVAIVECLAAFGEQIAVKVTSRDNPNSAATCTVDYVRKVDKTDFTWVWGYHSTKDSSSTYSSTVNSTEAISLAYYSAGRYESQDLDKVTFSNTYKDGGIGTILPSYTHSVTLAYTDEFIAAAEVLGISITKTPLQLGGGYNGIVLSTLVTKLGFDTSRISTLKSDLLNISQALEDGQHALEFVVTTTCEYETVSSIYYADFVLASIQESVNMVLLDSSSIVF